MLEILFWLSFGLLLYVYVGYPALLMVAVAFSPRDTERAFAEWPRVTLVVSAFNERDVIAAKIDNSLALDYPTGRLEVVVVSDASDDGTDDIVRRFAEHGVKLLRMADRGGKTLGLNSAVATATGEIVVFSDANAMFEVDALRALVLRFADPRVGAAVGESTYQEGETDSERSEGLYWRYETWIKEMESRTGSVVGGDGAIYGVRRSLYEPMPADALSDFVNPLQVVRAGHRCVYEPRARSVERAASAFAKEFKRKVRIVNRAWRATLRMKVMLNPFAHGWFALKLISHKLLRWWAPLMLVSLFFSNMLLWNDGVLYQWLLVGQIAFYAAAAAGWILKERVALPSLLYVPYFFCLVNVASATGIVDAFRGRTYTTWTTARATR